MPKLPRFTSITVDHLVKLGELLMHHKDPFDRLLVAQAISEGLTVVSKDEAFQAYGVPVVWD